MTSPSDHKESRDVEQRVNTALDNSVSRMSKQTLDDIYKARQTALHTMKAANSADVPMHMRMKQWIAQPMPRVALPVAAAVLIALSLEYGSVDPVPALPVAMISEEVPTEDLSLLEDLEFVTWLAENETEALL